VHVGASYTCKTHLCSFTGHARALGSSQIVLSVQQLEDSKEILTEIYIIKYRKLIYICTKVIQLFHHFNCNAKMAGMESIRNFMKTKSLDDE
jgi:hypothetical protein